MSSRWYQADSPFWLCPSGEIHLPGNAFWVLPFRYLLLPLSFIVDLLTYFLVTTKLIPLSCFSLMLGSTFLSETLKELPSRFLFQALSMAGVHLTGNTVWVPSKSSLILTKFLQVRYVQLATLSVCPQADSPSWCVLDIKVPLTCNIFPVPWSWLYFLALFLKVRVLLIG